MSGRRTAETTMDGAGQETLLSAACDGVVRKWATDGSSLCIMPPGKAPVNALCPDDAACRVFVAKHTHLASMDLATNKTVMNVAAHKSNILDLDRSEAVSLVYTAGEDSQLKAVDPRSDTVINLLDLGKMRVSLNCLRVSGERLLFGDSAGFLHVMDVRNMRQALTTRGLSSNGLACLDTSPTGHVCTMDDAGSTFYWAPESGAGGRSSSSSSSKWNSEHESTEFRTRLPVEQATSCQFAADGRLIITSLDEEAWVFSGASDLHPNQQAGDKASTHRRNGETQSPFVPLYRLGGLEGGAWSACMSLSGQYVFLGCEDKCIAVYDLHSPAQPKQDTRDGEQREGTGDADEYDLLSSHGSAVTVAAREKRKASVAHAHTVDVPAPNCMWRGHEFDVTSVVLAVTP